MQSLRVVSEYLRGLRLHLTLALLISSLAISACTNPAPRDGDSAANLAQIGAEAARIAAEMGARVF